MKICIIGLGRLGAPFATCWLKRGFEVIGVDKNPIILDCLRNRKSPVVEPLVEEILQEHGHRLTVSDNIKESVKSADITFILVSTPSNLDGTFSPALVLDVCNHVGEALKEKSDHIVVVASTISPGAVNKTVIPALEQASGKTCGTDFDVCYVPEWVALGELVKGFLDPDFTIIGADNPKAGERVAELYSEFLSAGMHKATGDWGGLSQQYLGIRHMSIINAEIAKVCLNAYIATKITFANAIANYCERTPGADAAVVTSAIGEDSRIGSKYFRGGTSYGGPCFPRDIQAFSALGGMPHLLAETVDVCNGKRVKDLGRAIAKLEPIRVGILGMAFKAGTAVIQDSPSLWLAHWLNTLDIDLIQYDPLIVEEGISNDLEDTIISCDVLVLMNPCKEFKSVNKALWQGKRIIDCWRCLPDVESITLGKYNEVFR